MSEANMENLSAAMDGQLSKDELRFLLRRLDRDASLLDAWARYHVAGDGLRRQLPPLASTGFAARVMEVIEGEQAVTAVSVSPKRRDWLRLSVGGAIAASVAVAALMISQPTAPDSEHGPATASVTPQGTHAGNTLASVNATTRAGNDVLAAVPPSLSAYSASGLSQRASVTLGDPSDNPLFQQYSSSQRYSSNGYRTLNNRDGSYLLLIDTPQAKAPVQNQAYQAGAGR
jgi:sigma-E factor negative regulatory protein RseA